MSTTASSSAEPSSSNPVDWSTSDAARFSATTTEFISFAIGDEQFGVDIMAVREIKGWSSSPGCRSSPTICAACSTCAA